jgi:peroxiredoxin
MGVNVVGMTYDHPLLLAFFHEEHELAYPLLHDEDGAYFEALGIRNPDYEPGDRAFGVPLPGIIFVRPDGVLALKFARPGYRDRPAFEEVYEAVRAALAANEPGR